MELDPKNVADRSVARKIVAVRDQLSTAEKRTLSAELAKSNPNVQVIQNIVNSK